MSDVDLSDIASIEPAEFARLVRSTPDAKITEMMAGEHRTAILDEIFGRFPAQFRADRAGTTSAVIHWAVGGRTDGGTDTYQVVIENGACTTSSSPDRDARLTITLGALQFLKIVAGASDPTMLFMTGKLKAKGDLGLAASIGKYFSLPKG